ncbi:MAG: hypothetical protein AYK18_11270 [Theionarchaea archaeon DG-70]|nr:MAG: hypothetical protein AYK18_11270 [Theionarchaea archaeon DG-70]
MPFYTQLLFQKYHKRRHHFFCSLRKLLIINIYRLVGLIKENTVQQYYRSFLFRVKGKGCEG